MAYESGSLETLNAASGGDPELFAELRAAFTESLAKQIDLLERARCDGNWIVAATRIRSLAAAFQASDLLVISDEAMQCAPGEPTIIKRLKSYLESLV